MFLANCLLDLFRGLSSAGASLLGVSISCPHVVRLVRLGRSTTLNLAFFSQLKKKTFRRVKVNWEKKLRIYLSITYIKKKIQNLFLVEGELNCFGVEQPI